MAIICTVQPKSPASNARAKITSTKNLRSDSSMKYSFSLSFSHVSMRIPTKRGITVPLFIRYEKRQKNLQDLDEFFPG